jgi:molybdopterin biosynthesis enzyme
VKSPQAAHSIRRCRPGQAARIFTGGVVPARRRCRVIQEDTARDGDTVTVNEAIADTRQNIRGAGIDFATRATCCCARRVC